MEVLILVFRMNLYTYGTLIMTVKQQFYYTTINPTSGQTYGFSNQLDIVLKDQWHTLTLTLNGQYVYININDKTVFNKVVSVGTRIP